MKIIHSAKLIFVGWLALQICPKLEAQLFLVYDNRYVMAGENLDTASFGQDFEEGVSTFYSDGIERASQGSYCEPTEIYGTGSGFVSGSGYDAESYLVFQFQVTEEVNYQYYSSSGGSWGSDNIGVEAAIPGGDGIGNGPYSSLGFEGWPASGSGLLYPGITYFIQVFGIPSQQNSSINWQFQLTVSPTTSKPFFSDAQKTEFAADSQYEAQGGGMSQGAAGDILAAAAAFAQSGPLGQAPANVLRAFAIGLFAGGAIDYVTGQLFSVLAADPVDTNFTVVALPILPALNPVISGTNVTQAAADASNGWLTNQEEIFAYTTALNTSINRAQGAVAATNAFWEAAQMKAAVQYEAGLAGCLDQEPALRSNMVAQLLESGFPAITVTPAEVISNQMNIAAGNELDTNFLAVLCELGANGATITNIEDEFMAQDPNAISGAFPQSLVNTNLDSAEFALAAGLRGSSLVLINLALLPTGQVRFDFPTEPGYNYTVQFNRGLADATEWTTLLATNATAGLVSFTNNPPIGSQAGFYRVVND